MGSEMCIRDRSTSTNTGLALQYFMASMTVLHVKLGRMTSDPECTFSAFNDITNAVRPRLVNFAYFTPTYSANFFSACLTQELHDSLIDVNDIQGFPRYGFTEITWSLFVYNC